MSVVIIPIYCINNDMQDMTDKCIESLLETASKYIGEVIVVDDGSPVQKYRTNAKTLFRRENGGYAAAVNDGLAKAAAGFAHTFIICNNDIEFIQPDWHEHLVLPLNRGYDVSSIRTTDSDGWQTEDKITEGDKFGSIWAMKREVYNKIGGLDEGFGKGYFEDLDYQKRAEDAGFRVAKNHSGLVHHRGKATFRQVDPDDTAYTEAMEKYRQKWGRVD